MATQLEARNEANDNFSTRFWVTWHCSQDLQPSTDVLCISVEYLDCYYNFALYDMNTVDSESVPVTNNIRVNKPTSMTCVVLYTCFFESSHHVPLPLKRHNGTAAPPSIGATPTVLLMSQSLVNIPISDSFIPTT